MSKLRTEMRTASVAVVSAALTVALVQVAPSVAAAVVRYARNAGKVDGKHAVSASASLSKRKGKLVATSATTGRLPNNIIAKAPDADRLDGKDARRFALLETLSSKGTINQSINPVDWTKLKEVPPGFEDGKDAFGPRAYAQVRSDGAIVAAHSTGVESAATVVNGAYTTYCFQLDFAPAHILVTPDLNGSASLRSADASPYASFAATALTNNCTGASAGAEALVTFRSSTSGPAADFFVAFMDAPPAP